MATQSEIVDAIIAELELRVSGVTADELRRTAEQLATDWQKENPDADHSDPHLVAALVDGLVQSNTVGERFFGNSRALLGDYKLVSDKEVETAREEVAANEEPEVTEENVFQTGVDFETVKEPLPPGQQTWVPIEQRPEFRQLSRREVEGQRIPGGGYATDYLDAENRIRVANAQDRIRRLNTAISMIAYGGDINAIALHENTYKWNDAGEIIPDDNFAQDAQLYSEFGFRLKSGSEILRQNPIAGLVPATSVMNEFHGMTKYEIESAWHTMSDETMRRWKIRLANAGYYDKAPVMGVETRADWAAMSKFIDDNQAGAAQGKTMEEVMSDSTEAYYERQRLDRLDQQGGGSDGGSGLPDYQRISVNGIDTYTRLARGIMEDELGMRLDEDALKDLAKRAQAREISHEQGIAMNFRNAVEEAGSPDASSELANWADAVKSVAGDGYGISASDWPTMARFAGLDPTAERSTENERQVVEALGQMFFTNTGDWHSATSSWFMGPAAGVLANTPDQYRGDYSALTSLSDDVLRDMRDRIVNGGGPGSTTPGGAPSWIIEAGWDPQEQVRQEMIAANKLRHQTWQYAQRGADFFSMLGSLL